VLLLVLLALSLFERKLDDDRFMSVLIRIFALLSFDFVADFSSFSPTTLPLREDTPVNGGLGGAFWLSECCCLLSSLFPSSLSTSVRSVGSGVGIPGLLTASLL
jgi:hypothetical protein